MIAAMRMIVIGDGGESPRGDFVSDAVAGPLNEREAKPIATVRRTDAALLAENRIAQVW